MADNVLPLRMANNEQESEQELWDAFWTLYPRREGRKDAVKRWIHMSRVDKLDAIVALADWRRVWQAQNRENHLVLMPWRWLEGEHWTDELPRGLGPRGGDRHTRPEQDSGSNAVTGAAHPQPRGEIPEHVKAMLAKLRAK
jgi:hypothetical protein